MASSKDIMLKFNLEDVPTYSTVHEIYISQEWWAGTTEPGVTQLSFQRTRKPQNLQGWPGLCTVISCIAQAPKELKHATYAHVAYYFKKFPLHFVLGAAPRTAHTSLKLPLKAIHPEWWWMILPVAVNYFANMTKHLILPTCSCKWKKKSQQDVHKFSKLSIIKLHIHVALAVLNSQPSLTSMVTC